MTLRITSFDWDEHNLWHIENHPIHPFQRDAVEELFLSGKFKVRKTRMDRYIALGQNLDGQYLVVVFQNKGGGKIRPISARTMEHWEKRLYGRK